MNPQSTQNSSFDDAKFNAVLQAHNYTPPVQPGQPTDWYSQMKANSKAQVPSSNTSQPVTPAKPTSSPQNLFGDSLVGKGLNALSTSEQAVGNDLTAGFRANSESNNEDLIHNSRQDSYTALQSHINALKSAGKDSSHAENALASIKANDNQNNPYSGFQAAVPESTKTNLQGLGDVAGVAADVLSAGSYGQVGTDAKALMEGENIVGNSGKLLTKSGGIVENLATKAGIPTAEKVITPVVESGVKQTLGQTLKTIGKDTAVHSAIGAGTGYGYDVANNAQQGKTGIDLITPGAGTATGALLPIAIGGIRAASAVTSETAPRIINSLVKPKTADFSYGKNPGRTVSEMGIVGNNLDDFANNINAAKNDIGNKIGAVYENPANANIRINGNDEITKLDSAITNASKGGKNNQSIVTQLQNIKDSLLYDHQVNADGVIEKTAEQPRDLSSLTTKEAQDLKQKVAAATQFTGKPSDDKTINSVLKDMYGGLKTKLNDAVAPNNPEIKDLNQKYADLTSAEIATRNGDKIVQRSNLVSLPQSIGGVGATVSALALGTAALPATLAGIGMVGLEKALGTPAAKTRIAAWLGKESPSVIQQVINKNPEIAPILRREFSNLASKLGSK